MSRAERRRHAHGSRRASRARAGGRVEGDFTGATRSALFVLTSAADAGFRFRAAGPGRLQIQGPPDMSPDLCEPVVAAIRANGAEILRLIRWLDDERRHGRIWRPRPQAKGAPQ